MKDKVYKLSKLRALGFWIAPVLLSLFIAVVVYSDYKSTGSFSVTKLTAYSILSIFFLLPFFVLYFNHYKYVSKTTVSFDEEAITINEPGRQQRIPFEAVNEVIQFSINNKYTDGRLPWADVYKWHIITEEAVIKISSLLISKSNLTKYIKNNITYKFTYFPFYN